MQFTQALLAAATIALASANSIHFVNQGTASRTIHFKPSAGKAAVDSTDVAGSTTVIVDVPESWIGMAYSVTEGATDNGFGMLAEFAFNAMEDMTFFDVSAIDAPEDHDGVKFMMPLSAKEPFSGCENQQFPCDNVYNLPNDVQTKVTSEKDIVVLLGNIGGLKKRTGASSSVAGVFNARAAGENVARFW